MSAPAGLPADRVVTLPSERRDTVVGVIDSARRSLSLSLFRCNDQAVLAALTRAVARGVSVDVLLTQRAKGGKRKRYKLWGAIEATGATLHPYSDPVVKYHAKYLVADDGPALVASLNFTRKCFKRTVDAIVVTHDPAVVHGLRAILASDQRRASLPNDLPSRLIVGPERARRQFTELISSARASIQLIDAKVSDPALTALLRARRDAGLAVTMYDAKRLGGLKSHGKVMLIDDSLAVVGGLSLNALGLDFRREVAIVVDEPTAVASLRRMLADLSQPGQPRAAAGFTPNGETAC